MSSATVLVVDDEALIRWSLTERLESEGYNLDEVAAMVERALETTRLRREVRQPRANAARPYAQHARGAGGLAPAARLPRRTAR